MRSDQRPHHVWLFGLIIVLVMLMGIAFPRTMLRAATPVILSLSPSPLTMVPGETVTMTIEVQAGTQSVDGVAAYLDFDPARFALSGVSPGADLPFPLANQVDNTVGTLDLVRGALAAPFPSGTFVLATFQLQAIGTVGPGTLTFNQGTPSPLRQSDITFGGTSVLGSVANLTVNVVDPGVPTATATMTATTISTVTATITATAIPTAVATMTATTTPTATATMTATATPTVTATVPGGNSVILSMSPAPLTMAPDETVTMKIEVQAGTQSVDGVAAYLDFDPARFALSGVSPGADLPFSLTNQVDNTVGTLDLVRGALVAPFPSGTFVLATFQLQAIGPVGPGTLTFNQGTPSPLRQSDVTSGGASVLGSVTNLTVNVVDPGVPTATATMTATTISTATATMTATTFPTAAIPAVTATMTATAIPTVTATMTATATMTPSPTPPTGLFKAFLPLIRR